MKEYRSFLAKQRKCRRDIEYKLADSESSSDNEWKENAIFQINATSFETKMKPNSQFKDYRDGFNNLINIKTINIPKIGKDNDQAYIVSCVISNDSEVAITIIKTWDREYWVYMYDLTT